MSFSHIHVSLQLVRRIYKGIPLQLRGEVWCLLLDVPKIKEEKKDFYEINVCGGGGVVRVSTGVLSLATTELY
ncbi:unnamed protein product [Coregonus sp. 'balchen']|nr:unnamed protein product [Coregonus sp. 'balchen']